MLPTREKVGKTFKAVGETKELSKIVYPRMKKSGVASGDGEGGQRPRQRVVRLDGIRL